MHADKVVSLVASVRPEQARAISWEERRSPSSDHLERAPVPVASIAWRICPGSVRLV
jgi:hypothetical protein